jgi:hypothetical protein
LILDEAAAVFGKNVESVLIWFGWMKSPAGKEVNTGRTHAGDDQIAN